MVAGLNSTIRIIGNDSRRDTGSASEVRKPVDDGRGRQEVNALSTCDVRRRNSTRWWQVSMWRRPRGSSANAVESAAKFVERSERCALRRKPSYKNTV